MCLKCAKHGYCDVSIARKVKVELITLMMALLHHYCNEAIDVIRYTREGQVKMQ